jgi:hypothetical protein
LKSVRTWDLLYCGSFEISNVDFASALRYNERRSESGRPRDGRPDRSDVSGSCASLHARDSLAMMVAARVDKCAVVVDQAQEILFQDIWIED